MKTNLISFFIFTFLINCKPIAQKQILAVDGTIDFSKGAISQNGPLPLDGIWNIYPGISFHSFVNKGNHSPLLIKVPGEWSANDIAPKKGIVLYRLLIRTAEVKGIFALKIYEFPQSYRLYVNRRLILENGKYSENLTNIRRSLTRPIAFFNIDSSETEILIEAANFDEPNPGPRRSLLFGSMDQILKIQDFQHFSDMVSFGILLIMSLYHFGLYYQRRKENGSFIFGTFCLVISFRIFVTEEHYLHRFLPQFPPNVEWMLDVLSFLILTPLLILLFFYSFRKDFHRYLIRPSLLVSIFILLAYLITKSEFVFNIALIFSFIAGLYFTFLLLRGIKKKRTGAKIFFLGWIVFLATSGYDMLAYNNLIRSIYLSHIGFLFFIFSQAYYLSIRFNQALSLSEDLTESLETKVTERTLALNQSLSIIQSDLNIARKLQQAILNGSKTDFKDLAVITHYDPVSEVGGDFYDIRQISEGRYRFFLADATGHGVQSALVTMIIKSECENLLSQSMPLNQIFFLLNESYTKKFQSLNLLFSAFLCDLDLINRKLNFVSAGHPPQFLIQENSIKGLKSKGKLMGYSQTEVFQEIQLDFLKSDKLLLFSDGIYEDFNADQKIFGEDDFAKLVQSNSHLQINDLVEKILSTKQNFKGSLPNEDDITLLGVELK